MASHAFASDTLLLRVHRSEVDVRRKFLRECETVHTPPNSRKRPDSSEPRVTTIQPSSRSRCTKAAVHWLCAANVPEPSTPIVGSFPPCCARAASGHAAAALLNRYGFGRLLEEFVEREGHLIGCNNVVQPRVLKREPLPSLRHVDQGSAHAHIWGALSHPPTLNGAFSTLHGSDHDPPLE